MILALAPTLGSRAPKQPENIYNEQTYASMPKNSVYFVSYWNYLVSGQMEAKQSKGHLKATF